MKFSEWLKLKEDGDLNAFSTGPSDPSNRDQEMTTDLPPGSKSPDRIFGKKKKSVKVKPEDQPPLVGNGWRLP